MSRMRASILLSSIRKIPIKWFSTSILTSFVSLEGIFSRIQILFSFGSKCFTSTLKGSSFRYFSELWRWSGIYSRTVNPFIITSVWSGKSKKFWVAYLSRKHLTCSLYRMERSSSVIKTEKSCLFLPLRSTPMNNVFLVYLLGSSFLRWHNAQCLTFSLRFIHSKWYEKPQCTQMKESSTDMTYFSHRQMPRLARLITCSI